MGLALLGGVAIWLLAADGTVGSAFTSALSPHLGLDGLSAVFLATVAVTAVPALVFATDYVPQGHAPRAVGALTGAFLLSLVGLLSARDVITFLAFWELMTVIPAAAILAARRDEEALRSVFLYLGVTHLGGAGVWVALLVAAQHGAIGDPAALAAAGAGTQALVAAAALVGFGTKAGLAPLHAWLPRAHPVAPAHLSALMSGLMVKLALYGLIRVELQWLGATPLWLGLALLAAGAVSAVGGVVYALLQRDLKRLLAFSSIENVGIVTATLGASLLLAARGDVTWSAIAFAAALLHVINHAAFKTLLFLGAGAFEKATGTLDLDRLGGLLRTMPKTAGAFAIGALALAGVPPLNGFASEWLALQSALHVALHGSLGVALAGAAALAVLAATAAIAAMAMAKVAGLALLGPSRDAAAGAREAPRAMRAGMSALALGCVALGLFPGLLLPTLAGLAPAGAALPTRPGFDLPGTGSLPVLTIALVLAALVGAVTLVRGPRRAAAPAPTWTCGQRLVPALRWSSAGFDKPLRLVLEAVLRPRRELEVATTNGVVQSIDYASEPTLPVDRFVAERAPAHGLRAAAFVRRLQTGSVRTYALYLLGLVLVLLALVRTGALG